MSRHEDVVTSIWVDLMGLTPNAKLLYLWSFTNGHNNMAGLYKIHPTLMSAETGIPEQDVADALRELSEQRFAFYEDGVMFVRSRVKMLRQKTSQIAKSIRRSVEMVSAHHPLRRSFLEVYSDESWLRSELGNLSNVSLAGLSSEGHESADKQGDHVTLNGVSPDTPMAMAMGLVVSSDKADVERPAAVREQINELFAYWQKCCDHAQAKLTPERRRAVDARLKQGYTVEQIKQAIDGAAAKPFINESGKKFDDLELICRTGSKVEDFLQRRGLNARRDKPSSSGRFSEYDKAAGL